MRAEYVIKNQGMGMIITRRLRIFRHRTARWFLPPVGVVLGGADRASEDVTVRSLAAPQPKVVRGQRAFLRVL